MRKRELPVLDLISFKPMHHCIVTGSHQVAPTGSGVVRSGEELEAPVCQEAGHSFDEGPFPTKDTLKIPCWVTYIYSSIGH